MSVFSQQKICYLFYLSPSLITMMPSAAEHKQQLKAAHAERLRREMEKLWEEWELQEIEEEECQEEEE